MINKELTKKENLRQVRNKMIKELWEENKSWLEMKDISYIFRIEIAQVYRIIKGRKK